MNYVMVQHFGGYIFLNNSVILLLLCSWLIFLLSKAFFKRDEINPVWNRIFFLMTGFPMLMQLVYGSWFGLVYAGLENGGFTESIFINRLTGINIDLFPILLLFFTVYLVHFIFLVIRHIMLRKNNVTMGN